MRVCSRLFAASKAPSSRVLTIPNVLTLSRIVSAPLLGQAIVEGKTGIAVAVLGYAALTDVADGWIARKLGQESDLGSYLDPLADKMLVTVGCVALGTAGSLFISTESKKLRVLAFFLLQD